MCPTIKEFSESLYEVIKSPSFLYGDWIIHIVIEIKAYSHFSDSIIAFLIDPTPIFKVSSRYIWLKFSFNPLYYTDMYFYNIKNVHENHTLCKFR
jgi:hypothetical protein